MSASATPVITRRMAGGILSRAATTATAATTTSSRTRFGQSGPRSGTVEVQRTRLRSRAAQPFPALHPGPCCFPSRPRVKTTSSRANTPKPSASPQYIDWTPALVISAAPGKCVSWNLGKDVHCPVEQIPARLITPNRSFRRRPADHPPNIQEPGLAIGLSSFKASRPLILRTSDQTSHQNKTAIPTTYDREDRADHEIQ